MQNLFVWLLERPSVLGKITPLLVVLPMLFIRIPSLEGPMLLAGIMLFVTVNWNRIEDTYDLIGKAHWWLKLQYFYFGLGLVVAIVIFNSLLQGLIDLFFVITAIYLLTYVIWFNSINKILTEGSEDLVLRSNTNSKIRNIDFEGYLIPLLTTFLIVFIYISINSVITTRARSIFDIQFIHWTFTLVILLIHYIVDALFRDQIIWRPNGGTTTYKEHDWPGPPNNTNPRVLYNYFNIVKKSRTPPSGVFEFLDNNLLTLVENAQELRYFPFQIQLVNAFCNWGKSVRSHLHVIMLIILSSVSKYRLIGLIPLYKRHLFYSGLQAICTSESMTYPWRELIEYEVTERKDSDHVLDWIIGSPYKQESYEREWIRSWNGIIYKGKEGYYEAVNVMAETRHLPLDLRGWRKDIWDLLFQFASLFIGEEGRKILSSEAGLYDKLLFLTNGGTSQEYEEHTLVKQQSLSNQSERLVYSTPSPPLKPETEEDKRKIIEYYLTPYEEEEAKAQPVGDMIRSLLHNYTAKPQNFNIKQIGKMLVIVLLFSINVGIIYFIDLKLVSGISPYLISGQAILMILYAINPAEGDVTLFDQDMGTKDALQEKTLSYQAMQISALTPGKIIIVIAYAFALLLSVQLILR